MRISEPLSAALHLQQARSLGQVQLAVAAKFMKMSRDQGQAAVQLIEAASENMARASAEVQQSLGHLVDIQV